MKKVLDVPSYLELHPKWKELLSLLRAILLSFKEFEESIRWSTPAYLVNGKPVVSLGAYKEYVSLWFFQGILLEDKAKVLINAQQNKTYALRQWRFREAQKCDSRLIKRYVQEAINNQLAGKIFKPSKERALILPSSLKLILEDDKVLRDAFFKLTQFQQREYAGYITEAKKEITVQKRLEKIVPLILENKGLNDKYK